MPPPFNDRRVKLTHTRELDEKTYRGHYNRGWKASSSEGALERGDMRGEPPAWYDGYMDAAVGRRKYSIPTGHGPEDQHDEEWERGGV